MSARMDSEDEVAGFAEEPRFNVPLSRASRWVGQAKARTQRHVGCNYVADNTSGGIDVGIMPCTAAG